MVPMVVPTHDDHGHLLQRTDDDFLERKPTHKHQTYHFGRRLQGIINLNLTRKLQSIKTSFQYFGIASSIARALTYYAAKAQDTTAQETAKKLLDVIWANHKDSKGLYVRTDLSAFSNVNTKVRHPLTD